MAESVIVVEGLAQLRRDLRLMAPDVGREVAREVKKAAEIILVGAKAGAPRSDRVKPKHLAATGKVGLRGASAVIRFTAPYATVVHFGGTIAPRGVPIRFTPRPFLTAAAEAEQARFVEDLADRLDHVYTRHGWKGRAIT